MPGLSLPNRTDRGRADPWITASLIFLLALAVRWNYVGGLLGSTFWPRPDALEYVAGAQSIAQSGRYFLQVGAVEARPRYPPGFSLLLAVPLLMGVPAEHLWRFAALASAGVAALLAFVASLLTRHLGREPGRSGAFVGATIAGGSWALSPAGVAGGISVMSDETASLLVLISFLAAVRALWRSTAASGPTWASLSGLAGGVAAAVRPTSGLLLALALAFLFSTSFARLGPRRLTTLLGTTLAAASAPAILVSLLLWRSDGRPFVWTSYAFWEPAAYGPAAHPWKCSNFRELDRSPSASSARPSTNFETGGKLLLGWPGAPAQGYLGRGWPALALPALVLLYRCARTREGRFAHAALPVAGAVALWMAAHLLFWGGYFFPATRFFETPLALEALLVGTALGIRWIEGPGRQRWALAILIAALIPLTLQPHGAARRYFASKQRFGPQVVRERFDAWRRLSDEERRIGTVPFDTVEAQALGLLSPAEVRRIGSWGKLESTAHVLRLRAYGRLPASD